MIYLMIFTSKNMINTAVFSALLLILVFSHNSSNSQTFTKITQGSFVNDGGASRSVNFIDYDNDGDIDLYVSNGKRFGQRSFLYQNNAGNFTRIFNTGPVNDSLPFDGSSWGDFDNDGNIDMCTVTWYDSVTVLYKNDGGGNFSFMTGSPVVTDRGFSETCSWGDFDNDGLIDLFITNSRPTNSRNRLYRNLGSGNFSRIDSGAVFNDVGILSRNINWVDIDDDGNLDIFVSNEEGADEYMYKNNGGGYFTKVLNIPPTTNAGSSWSSSWGDYDNDGDFDLFVANWGNENNHLFRNEGNFNFTQITNDTMVNDPGFYACSGWGDYDNDGDVDMFVTQAYRTPNAPMKNNLYKNLLMENGTPSFEKITAGDLVNDAGYSYGFSWGDWDSDGDLDVFTARTYNENENNSAFLNNGNGNKWIEIKLTGTNTNKSAIGTRVRVKAVINGTPRWIVREVSGQSGYCGQNLDLHFGLGNAPVIDSIKVEWQSEPAEFFTGVNVNQIIRIVEGQGIIGIQQNGTEIPKGFNLYQNYPNPFNPSTKIKFDIPVNDNQPKTEVVLAVYDILGKQLGVLVNQQVSPGKYELDWNASVFPSGIYFYTLSSGNLKASKKMVLIK
jgi:enediyne biosynthesis protein E4